MKIDSVSTKLIQLALYLDQIKPGLVSEIWLDPSLVDDLKNSLPDKNDIPNHVKSLEDEIHNLSDARRKEYLVQMLRSLKFQIKNDRKKVALEKFTKECFGISIPRVSQKALQDQEDIICELEKKIGSTRDQVIDSSLVPNSKVENLLLENLSEAKDLVEKNNELKIDEDSFSLKTITNESWVAFNKHVTPFQSELIINLDYPVNLRNVRYFAFHEGYGGHHTELSIKDRLLIDGGRGEHGLVITYSPQTYISEAIAVNSLYFFGDTQKSKEFGLIEEYQHLAGAMLYNDIAYRYFQDGETKSELRDYLNTMNITEDSKKSIINFVTDEIYGIYTLVYYHAGEFLKQVYDQSMDKQRLLKEIYTQPTTPSLLKREQKS